MLPWSRRIRDHHTSAKTIKIQRLKMWRRSKMSFQRHFILVQGTAISRVFVRQMRITIRSLLVVIQHQMWTRLTLLGAQVFMVIYLSKKMYVIFKIRMAFKDLQKQTRAVVTLLKVKIMLPSFKTRIQHRNSICHATNPRYLHPRNTIKFQKRAA